MIEIDQTKFGWEGNCFQSCLASVLEVPLEAVPDFHHIYKGEDWLEECEVWLRKMGLGIAKMKKYKYSPLYRGYWIGIVKTAKDDIGQMYHAIIFRDGKVAHDPMPNNEFAKKRIEDVEESYVIALDVPRKFNRWRATAQLR